MKGIFFSQITITAIAIEKHVQSLQSLLFKGEMSVRNISILGKHKVRETDTQLDL